MSVRRKKVKMEMDKKEKNKQTREQPCMADKDNML